MEFLNKVTKLLDLGIDEESACRVVYDDMYADGYDPESYD